MILFGLRFFLYLLFSVSGISDMSFFRSDGFHICIIWCQAFPIRFVGDNDYYVCSSAVMF